MMAGNNRNGAARRPVLFVAPIRLIQPKVGDGVQQWIGP